MSGPKTIFITGATGFVGTRLLERLERVGGLNLRAIGRGAEPANFAARGIAWISRDLVTAPHAELCRALEGCDAALHLAGRAHVTNETATDPLAEYRRTNVEGSTRLARAATEVGVKKFIFLSSIKVNGEKTDGRAFTGEDRPAPEDAYGISKHEAEKALFRLGVETGMPVIALRPPLVYGPGVKANFLSLMKIVKKGVPFPLGGCHNRRSMIHIDNLCGAIEAAMNSTSLPPGAYTISDDEALSTAGVMQALAKGMNIEIWLPSVPAVFLNAMASVPGVRGKVQRLTGDLAVDNSEFKRVSGWQPSLTAQKALEQTGSWFVSHST